MPPSQAVGSDDQLQQRDPGRPGHEGLRIKHNPAFTFKTQAGHWCYKCRCLLSPLRQSLVPGWTHSSHGAWSSEQGLDKGFPAHRLLTRKEIKGGSLSCTATPPSHRFYSLLCCHCKRLRDNKARLFRLRSWEKHAQCPEAQHLRLGVTQHSRPQSHLTS